MKTNLTNTLIQTRLSPKAKPVYEPDGSVRWEPRTGLAPYIIFDAHRDAPVGFGVKVSVTKKTFILQRRVGKRVIKAKVGDVSDFPSVEVARDAARVMASSMRELGSNPNVVERRRAEAADRPVAEMTLADVFADYRTYLVHRADKPVKDTSLKNLDQALRRLARPGIALAARPMGTLNDKVVLKAFDTLAASPRPAHPLAKKRRNKTPGPGTRTSAEQTFRWASTAAAYVMQRESIRSQQMQRPPSIHVSPFLTLKAEGRFRSRQQLEDAYKTSQARNPLSTVDGSLGRFIEAVWARRCETPNNRTAADYLLLTLLWGTRRGEAAPLRWRSLISDSQAAISSWVDLDQRKLYLHDTKNGTDHELPLADAAFELLNRRWEDRTTKKGVWVFPARSSKAKAGHYLDSKAILAGIRESADIALLRTHDLRRTFGAIAEEVASYAVVKALLNHRQLQDPTTRYTRPHWQRIQEAMQRVERMMLSTAPAVHKAILGHLGEERVA